MHPLLALAGGVAVHALVLAAAVRLWTAPRTTEAPRVSDEVEVELLPLVPDQVEAVGSSVASVAHVARQHRETRATNAVPALSVESAEPAVLDAPNGDEPPLVIAPRRPVSLGLDGSLVRSLVVEDRKKHQKRATTGLRLGDELDTRDAAKGLGRSSGAISAAYRASSLAPPLGSAIFDVRADASGRVTSVVLVEFGSDGSEWRRVGEALKRELRRRRLRVPPGARGLSSMLRIERGELALSNSERGRTERGAALGQQSLGPKDVRDESTRASLENGRASPSLGVGPGTVTSSPKTRVVLLRERPL